MGWEWGNRLQTLSNLLGLYWDNGKQNGNYFLMTRAQIAWRFARVFSVLDTFAWFSAFPLTSETILQPVHPWANTSTSMPKLQ